MFSSTELIRKSKMIFNKIIDGSVEKAIILRDGKPSFLLMDFSKYEAVMSEFEELKEYVESIKESSKQENPKTKKIKKQKKKKEELLVDEPKKVEKEQKIEKLKEFTKESKRSKKSKKGKEKKVTEKVLEKTIEEGTKIQPKKIEFTIEPKPKPQPKKDSKVINKFSKDDIKPEVKFKPVIPPRPNPVKKEISVVIEDEIVAPLTEIIIDEEEKEVEVTNEEIDQIVPEIEEEEISEEEEIQTALENISSIDFDDNMRKIAENKIKEKILQARALREKTKEEERILIEQEEKEEQEIVNKIEEQKEQKQRELSEFWD
jgi:hypothetical protein